MRRIRAAHRTDVPEHAITAQCPHRAGAPFGTHKAEYLSRAVASACRERRSFAYPRSARNMFNAV
jgi:hypothetical protein